MPNMTHINDVLEDMDPHHLVGDLAWRVPACHTTIDAVILVEVGLAILARGGSRLQVSHLNRYTNTLNL